MIDPRLGQAGFRIGIFLVVTAGGLLLVVDRESPEFAVSCLTLSMALLFLGMIVLIVKAKS
jgi:hypothetical protein